MVAINARTPSVKCANSGCVKNVSTVVVVVKQSIVDMPSVVRKVDNTIHRINLYLGDKH